MARHRWMAVSVLAAGLLLALPVDAQSAISADGVVESKSGGIKFPDGSIQTAAAVPPGECPTKDPSDEMIWVAGVCIDAYEASVWSQTDGGTQYGAFSDDYPCSDNGQNCEEIYARSVPGVTPSRFITWFQAQAALANSGKRLPTNAEWQIAVLGTPDPGDTPGVEDCNTGLSSGPDVTGARQNCVSRWGHHDMVGNLWEWVADWSEFAAGCQNWSTTFGGDVSCIGRAEADANNHFPSALLRGGDWGAGTAAGAFAVSGTIQPSSSAIYFGFRGAR